MFRTSLVSLSVAAAFFLSAHPSHAVPFDLNFAAPGPDCPVEDLGCADLVDVVPGGGTTPPTGFPFLNYSVGGGNSVTGAAWTEFSGTIMSIGLGQMRQDIDFPGGGLGVDENTDNIDPGESIALFANAGASVFTLSSVLLGNHPGSGFNDSASFLLWWTSDLTMDWDSITLAINGASAFLAGLGELQGVAFESIDETFYLSAAAGDVMGVIPEPSTALLIGLGVAGLAARRRRNA